MCAWSSVCFDTTRGLLCSAVAPLLAQGFLSTQNRLNKLLLRKVGLTGREQRAGRTCMYCQLWQGAWFALDVENWSEEGTIKRVGLLLLLRRTRELASYVRAKPVFHIVWEVASLSLLHLICHLRSWAGPQEEYLPFEMDELCAVVLHVLLLSLLPGSYLWYLLFTLWEVICPQAVAISGCHPVPPGQAPFLTGRVIFSLYFISECACCLLLYLCWQLSVWWTPPQSCSESPNSVMWYSVLVSPEARSRPSVPHEQNVFWENNLSIWWGGYNFHLCFVFSCNWDDAQAWCEALLYNY